MRFHRQALRVRGIVNRSIFISCVGYTNPTLHRERRLWEDDKGHFF
jgi:hypothetical protein